MYRARQGPRRADGPRNSVDPGSSGVADDIQGWSWKPFGLWGPRAKAGPPLRLKAHATVRRLCSTYFLTSYQQFGTPPRPAPLNLPVHQAHMSNMSAAFSKLVSTDMSASILGRLLTEPPSTFTKALAPAPMAHSPSRSLTDLPPLPSRPCEENGV